MKRAVPRGVVFLTVCSHFRDGETKSWKPSLFSQKSQLLNSRHSMSTFCTDVILCHSVYFPVAVWTVTFCVVMYLGSYLVLYCHVLYYTVLLICILYCGIVAVVFYKLCWIKAHY